MIVRITIDALCNDKNLVELVAKELSKYEGHLLTHTEHDNFGVKLHFSDHKPLDIRVIVHSFEQAEVNIAVFEVEVSQEPSGMWCETFGTLDLLNAFLRGIRCGLSFPRAAYAMTPTLHELPSGWNLQRAPYQIWPEHVPGKEEVQIKLKHDTCICFASADSQRHSHTVKDPCPNCIACNQ